MISKLIFQPFALFAAVLAVSTAGSASWAQAGVIQEIPTDVIFKQGENPVSLKEALADVKAGQVVVLGEQHGSKVQSGQQMQVLTALREMGLSVSVGMEFFSYTHQNEVDQWRNDQLPESEFLKSIEWGQGFPFDAYREQVKFPYLKREYVKALNAPRSLTGKIAQVGVEQLSSEEKALLPPAWHLGNAAYQLRFNELMSSSGHVPSAEILDRYFQAQSTWDETMAWQSEVFLKAHPDQVLVIIVGEFHVQYGGGLPDRLLAHGLKPVSFSLLNLFAVDPSEQAALIAPTKRDGVRAAYVWTSRFDPKL